MRATARIAVEIGALGSVALMLYAARTNRHLLITVLFTIWVLAPFVALALAGRMSASWSPVSRATLHALTLIVTVGSLVIYGYRAVSPPRSTGAFVFVIVPPVSVVLLLIALAVAALISRRLSRKESM